VNAQSYKFDYHPAYGPAPMGGEPKSIAKLLSYENFRSIKLLNAAILNFGGGDAVIDKLIDQYAEASALYFQNKIMESAKAFKENQAAILAVAKQLAQKYSQDSAMLLKESINLNVRSKMKMQMKGIAGPFSSDKYLEQAQAGILKADEYYERYKDAKSVSAMDLITAIYYYRGAKESMFQMMRVLADSESKFQTDDEMKVLIAKKQVEPARRDETRQAKQEQKRKELIAKYLGKYARDMVDDKNMVYESKEKEK
jgi:hypothetical protein